MPKINKIGTFENKELFYYLNKDSDDIGKLYWGDVLICYFYKLTKIIIINEHTIKILSNKSDNNIFATFVTFNQEFHTIKSFVYNIKNDKELIYNNLIKVPNGDKFVLYSSEFGFVTSASYDDIIYNDDECSFNVTLKIPTFYGIQSLFGKLDTMGHLINDSLYFPLTGKTYLVDEHNINEEKFKVKLEKDILRQKNKQAYVEFEYNAYLKRQKKKVR